MLKKLLVYGMVLNKLSQVRHLAHLGRYYDKRLLWLLLVPPAVLLARSAVNTPKKKLSRPLTACLLGIAAGQLELMKLRAKAMVQ
jgi:hypothetical protein